MKKADNDELSALGINFLGLVLDSDLPTSMASAIGSFDPSVRTSRVQAGAESIERRDIVELIWKDFKNQTDTISASVNSLFEASNHNPTMLFNAAAQ